MGSAGQPSIHDVGSSPVPAGLKPQGLDPVKPATTSHPLLSFSPLPSSTLSLPSERVREGKY